MDDIERTLTVQLRERTPQPPHVCTAQDVWDRAPSSDGRRRLAPAGAVLAVVALVLAVAVVAALRGGPPPTVPTPRPLVGAVTNPSALIGPVWSLRTATKSDGTHLQVNPASAPTILIDRSFMTSNDCSDATDTVSAGRIVFHQDWVNGGVAGQSCGRPSPIPLTNFTFTLLTGTVRWRIIGDVLTVLRPHAGVLTFRATKFDATITGHVYEVGGPAPGIRRAIIGVVTLETPTGSTYPILAKTDAAGRFSAHVVPGRYRGLARSQTVPGAVCGDNQTVEARAHRTVHLDIYCQLN